MKKSLICLTVLTAMLGTNAYAATVGYEEDKVTPSGVDGNVKTVLIVKTPAEGTDISENDIYYIDQSAQNKYLDVAAGFVMKSGAPDGNYKLLLGKSDVTETTSDTEAVDFVIGLPANVDMEVLSESVSENDDGTFNMGFVNDGIELGKYKWLVVTFGTGDEAVTMGYPVQDLGTTVSGGTVKLGIQLNNIKPEYKDNVKLGFTAKENKNTDVAEGNE